MAKRGRNHRSKNRGNGKIDHHGLPIPTKVNSTREFMRLVNSKFPCIPGDIRLIKELSAFVDFFGQGAKTLFDSDVAEVRHDEVVDFWKRVMPTPDQARRATRRFIRVTADEVRGRVSPENIDVMSRISGVEL